jgi:O-antigen biosynthesis protein
MTDRQDCALVSVVTPCYNAGSFVAATIESVAAQSHPAIEHIIVDDASTDDSGEVLARYSGTVRAIRLDRNRGGGYARNVGARAARGRYLMFLDADDLIGAEVVRSLVHALHDGDAAIAYCEWKRLRQRAGRWVEEPRNQPLPAPDSDPLAGWLEGVWVPPCALLWSRGAYEISGGWDETLLMNQDGDIVMRALARGVAIRSATGGVALYRDHGDARASVSNTGFAEPKLRSLVRVLEKLTAELEEQGRVEGYRRPIGVAYQRVALLAFQGGATGLARECRFRGEALAGRRSVSRTAAGRLLARIVGLERKERIVNVLARLGVATGARKRSLVLRARAGGGAGPVDAVGLEPVNPLDPSAVTRKGTIDGG